MDNKLSDNILTGLDGVIEVNGKLNQTHVLSGAHKQEQYQLSYEALEITGDKNYFLSYLTYEDGTVHTYFFPIQFVGPQKIVFDVPFPVANIQFFIYGHIKLKDTKLQSVLDNTLTEEQKQLLNKVSTNSEYWDRIIAATSALGNILTNKLEGSINTALNSIAGSEGRMYWKDGKFICRDGKTDAESTMAMLLSPAGFMIADSKQDDGNWNWRTFGTGAGFTADEIIAGTLRAIAIEGVNITASTLTGGEIIGAKIKGGSLNINDRFIVDSDGDVQMSGAVTWGADNSPVKVKYSSDNKNWHYNFESNDTFAKYSYDGGLTWTEGIKIRGTDGINGVPGQNGADGQTYYTWIRYADDVNGTGISNSSAGKAYIGIAYNKETSTESNNPKDYAWTRIKGDDGKPGSDANVPSYIKSTKITGTSVESCTLTGNTITGGEIIGATIIGGSKTGVHTAITPSNPFRINSGTQNMIELWGDGLGMTWLKLRCLYDGLYEDRLTFKASGQTTTISALNAKCILTATGYDSGSGQGGIELNYTSKFEVYAGFAEPMLRFTDRGDTRLGRVGRYTDIYGVTNIALLNSLSNSELEVRNMELELKIQQQSIKQSEVEVSNMELQYRLEEQGVKQSEIEVKLMEMGVL